ncbi:LysR family transcriptional regulator [Methylobacterium sp. NEAU 140]|uniref:LysR family transcriptional regulator n=1 Tax=Methylobacterium sp. NEAU 140 TaxID=3064945 RepID=UPI002737411F|nr:LysR family transcriptional regulator [Methylobacterium sp. NEAU 140]MDP4025931.1 LysR family transcriptional regulator [Methylobacterium sp. NEAU 140]
MGSGAGTGSGDRAEARFYTDNIRTFVAVSEHGGVGRAARALGLSQPSVSQQVARLETLIGRRLFRRGADGVSLTPDGEILLRHARAMIGLSEAVGRSFGLDGRPVRLDVGLTEMFGLTALQRVLGLVARQNPGLALRIVLGRTETLAAGFADGAFDVVVSGPLGTPGARFLRSEPLAWIGRADAPGPVPDPVPLVLPLAPSRLRTVMLAALEGAGRSWTGAFEVSSVSAVEAAIEAGFGYCAAWARLPLRGPVRLGPESGLPALPGVDYVIHTRAGARDDLVGPFCDLIAEAVAAGP